MATVLHFPPHISEAQTFCALRFDGYHFQEVMAPILRVGSDEILTSMAMRVTEEFTFHTDTNLNFASFFALQRYLFKWGGERLTKYAKEHVSFDLLFLHLYRTEVPARFCNREWLEKWDALGAERQEEVARYVRNSFRRKGYGAKSV